MARRLRGSIRLWQTELFIVVIMVAILILSGSLSAGLTDTLTRMTETSELRNASALAQRLEASLPLGVGGRADIREAIAEYRDIYGGGIWVYSPDGQLLASAFDTSPTSAALESALLWATERNAPYAASDLRTGGWIVAAHPISRGDTAEGFVITASSADPAAAILHAVRDRMWVTFWVSLSIAGLLGFGFSALISRRIRQMSTAAAAIAAGDFDQRLPAGFAPDEIHDLAESYNTMARNLGETFGELQESRRQIAAVVESMAEGLLAFDSAGTLQVVNPEASRLLGITSGQSVGASVEEVTTEPGIIDAVHGALAGESSVATISPGEHVVLVHCTPLLGAEDAVEGAVLLLSDVTDRHRMEAAQRRFVADASHEMRTPIAALKGMLELLDDGAKNVPEVRDDFIHTMQLEADRLGRLVADLLTLARLEAGSMELKRAPVYVGELAGAVCQVMATLASQAEVTLIVEEPETETRVLADRDRIVQVLLSFVDNALKHAPAGSRVTLRAESRGRSVRISVSDEGPGIEPDAIERVFERFYRADSARGGTGTGLGLAIAKEIVEAHGSTIEVSSTSKAGTRFSFELPIAE